MRNTLFILFVLAISIMSCGEVKNDFDKLNNAAAWDLKFEDDCTGNWEKSWFLDGQKSSITHSEKGMEFKAGNMEGNDADHAVLWTKEIFKDDVKVEYEYTRTDEQTEWVNILYIQALGVPPFAEDISTWNHLRVIPSMKTYFTHMKALHISYAAYGKNNLDQQNDYVRVRQYPVLKGKRFSETKIPPASFKTGLFVPNETYKITVIKTKQKLYFRVKINQVSKLFEWDLKAPLIKKGRIGLRHMYTRSARYKNFKIYTKH